MKTYFTTGLIVAGLVCNAVIAAPINTSSCSPCVSSKSGWTLVNGTYQCNGGGGAIGDPAPGITCGVYNQNGVNVGYTLFGMSGVLNDGSVAQLQNSPPYITASICAQGFRAHAQSICSFNPCTPHLAAPGQQVTCSYGTTVFIGNWIIYGSTYKEFNSKVCGRATQGSMTCSTPFYYCNNHTTNNSWSVNLPYATCNYPN